MIQYLKVYFLNFTTVWAAVRGQALFLFVQFYELLLDPSRTDFMEGKPDVDNFVG
jgi:hypothetical protein